MYGVTVTPPVNGATMGQPTAFGNSRVVQQGPADGRPAPLLAGPDTNESVCVRFERA